MSRKKTLDLRTLRRYLTRAEVDNKMLTLIIKKPSQYVVECLSGKKPFTLSDLISIADLLNCEISDFMT